MDDGIPPGELAIGVVGVLLAVALLVVLIIDGVGGSAAPELDAEVTTTTQVGGGWAVAVDVVNDGGSAAQQVVVHGELRDGEAVVEEAEATVDYVAAGSSTTVVLRFQQNPLTLELDVRTAGFQPV